MYRPDYSDSDDDYDGFSFGDESQQRVNLAQHFYSTEVESLNLLFKHVQDGDLSEIKKILLENDIDINIPLNTGMTLLHYACKFGSPDIVEFLLKNGAMCNKQIESITPLMQACCCEKPDAAQKIVLILIEYGAVINISDKYGTTPFMFACMNGLTDVVELLLPKVSLEAFDNQGWTAIFHAIEKNRLEIVQILVEAGASVSIANRKGYTPRQVAQFHGFSDILEVMPKLEETYEVPSTYLTYNSIRDYIPRIFLKTTTPEFFQEVNTLLRDIRLEKFLVNFAMHNIKFGEFLTISDDRLEEIGIKFPFHRKIIQLELLNFHLNNWSKKSIARVKRKEKDTFYDILMITANHIKNLVVINSSIRYVTNNINSNHFGIVQLNTLEELQANLKLYKNSLAELRHVSKYLGTFSPNKPPLYIDYEDYIRQKREGTFRKYIKYSIFLGLSLIICLKYRKWIKTSFLKYGFK